MELTAFGEALLASQPLAAAPLSCSSCSRVGTYRPGTGTADVVCSNPVCDHEVNWSDFDLDQGERFVFVDAVLCVVTP